MKLRGVILAGGNRHYPEQDRLGSTILGGYWTDAGTLDSLASANRLVRDTLPRFSAGANEVRGRGRGRENGVAAFPGRGPK